MPGKKMSTPQHDLQCGGGLRFCPESIPIDAPYNHTKRPCFHPLLKHWAPRPSHEVGEIVSGTLKDLRRCGVIAATERIGWVLHLKNTQYVNEVQSLMTMGLMKNIAVMNDTKESRTGRRMAVDAFDVD